MLPHFVDECQESTALMFKYCKHGGVIDALREFYFGVRKLPVGCFENNCEMCQRDWPRHKCEKLDGGEMWKHYVEFVQLYCCDEKMYKEMLPLKNGQCRHCKTSLACGDHDIKSNLIRAEPHTLEQLQHAHDRFMFHYEAFVNENKWKHSLLAGDEHNISTASLNLFYDSMNSRQFQDELIDATGQNTEMFVDRFKGLLVDPYTPLSNYLVDTLHFFIVLANIVMNSLIIPLVQELEDTYPGVGIYVFFVACKVSGLKHLGSRLLQHAKLACKSTSKLVRLTDAYNQKYNGPALSLPQLIAKRWKEKDVPKMKVTELRTTLRKLNPNVPQDVYARMNKESLAKVMLHGFSKYLKKHTWR